MGFLKIRQLGCRSRQVQQPPPLSFLRCLGPHHALPFYDIRKPVSHNTDGVEGKNGIDWLHYGFLAGLTRALLSSTQIN